MTNIDKALDNLRYVKDWFQYGVYEQRYCEAVDMAIRALEAQKRLEEYREFDICEWQEDYDWDENNISEYHSVASVNDFLIDELKGENDED